MYVVGNWKMHLTRGEALGLAGAVVEGLGALEGWSSERVRVGVAPPFPYLEAVAGVVGGAGVEVLAGGRVEWPKSVAWYVRDPDNYEIEVAWWREGASQF